MSSETQPHSASDGPHMKNEKEKHSGPFIPIGQYLRELREKRHISLAQISEKTRIHLTLLKELENNNIAALPDKTYVKGFIKSYAKEVGADVEAALQCLETSYERFLGEGEDGEGRSLTSTEEQGSPSAPERPKGEFLFTPKSQRHKKAAPPARPGFFPWPVILFSLLVVAYPGYYFFNTIRNANFRDTVKTPTIESQDDIGAPANVELAQNIPKSENHPVPTAPKEPLLAKEGKPQAIMGEQSSVNPSDLIFSLVPRVPSSEEARMTIPPQKETPEMKKAEKNEVPPVELDSQGQEKSISKNTQIVEGDVGVENIKFERITRPLFKVMKDAPEASDGQILPDTIKGAINENKQNVFINAVDGDSWITYKKDDAPIKSFILKKDQHLFIQGEKVRILMGNVNATKVFYNNQLLDPQSPTGVKSLVFPPDKAKENNFSLPLFVHHKDGKIFTAEEYQAIQSQVKERPKVESAPPPPSESLPVPDPNDE